MSTGPSFAFKGRSGCGIWWDVFMDDPGGTSRSARCGFFAPYISTSSYPGGCFAIRRPGWVLGNQANGNIQFLNRAVVGFGGFFLPGLIMAMVYTASQDQRGMKTNYFFFTVPSQAVPYCMILFSLLTNPGVVPMELTGIVAAHLHDFLTRLWPEFGGGSNWLPTPGFVSWFVQTPRILQRRYGTAIRQPNDKTTDSDTGASTGSVLPDSWKTRGSGHRLGGK